MLFLEGNVLDCLKSLPDQSVHCCISSPPYFGLRSYLDQSDPRKPFEIGTEKTPDEYVAKMIEVFREIKRVLRDDGTLWLNLGDSFASGGRGTCDYHLEKMGKKTALAQALGPKHIPGFQPKNLLGIPWRVAFALQADGWYLRSDIIWSKPNPMPESVTDRPTKSHEYIFLLTKSERYFYDHVAIQEESVTQDLHRPYGSEGAWQLDGRPQEQRHGGELRKFGGNKYPGNVRRTYSGNAYTPIGKRNKRDVWTISTQPFPGSHFAVFPEALVEPCILAGTSEAGCCPKCGAPWVRAVEKETVNRAGWGASNPHHATPFGTHGPSLRGEGRCGDVRVTTLGWQPTCSCGHDPVPCTVLDPFGGSGTVAKVSRDLGRDSIYIDLNPDYVQMAMKRVGESLFNKNEHRKIPS